MSQQILLTSFATAKKRNDLKTKKKNLRRKAILRLKKRESSFNCIKAG